MEEENTTISTSDDLAKQQEILDDNRRLQEQFKRIDEEKIQTAKGVEERAKTRQAELADPHGAKDPQDYGFGENIKELQNAFVGGGRDTISSVLTLPERATDMFRGEDVGGKEYKLDWDPLGDELNPVTKTWWGNLIRGGVHFAGTTAVIMGGAALLAAAAPAGAAGAVGAAGVAAAAGSKATKVTAAARWIANGGKIAAAGKKAKLVSKIGHGAVVGGVSDLISEYSQEDNATGALAKQLGDRFPPILHVLATKNTDSPLMKTFKNVVEGMGIGAVFDLLGEGIGRSLRQVGYTGKPDVDEMTMKTGDKIFEMRRAKVEAAAKEAVDKNLRKLTAQKLFEKGIDFDKLSAEEQLTQMAAVAKRNKGFKTWSPPEDAETRAARKTVERGKDVEAQTIEQGRVELEQPGPGAFKNKPMMDQHQGNPNSRDTPYDVHKQAKLIDNDYGSEAGSTGQVLTTAAARRMADSADLDVPLSEIKKIARDMLGDVRYQALIKEIRKNGGNFEQVWKDSYRRMQEVLEGRDASRMTPEEFWKAINEDMTFQTGGQDNMEAWAMENVITADLINASIFKKIRDLASAGLEIKDVFDLHEPGSIVQSLRDNLIVGLTNTKRSRYLISQEFRSLRAQAPDLAKKAARENYYDIHAQTKAQVDMMMELARKAPSDDLLHALLEAFSMSNKIYNWDDFDNFMRKKLKGSTDVNGRRETGLLIRELQGMMINSVLSGPKTPLRALMGTSTAVVTKPLAQLLGGVARYGTSGFSDSVTMRNALASINAMRQTVPEAWQYFKHRLNGYWSGDISTIRSRYAEYSASDAHWALLGEWSETKGTAGDKFWYGFANMARAANNSNLLTYSTKLMAATDDAFTMIMARMRAREKALNLALESQADELISEINPKIIADFEDRFYKEIFDESDGSINDSILEIARQEATLTKDLTGIGQKVEQVFNDIPMLKPFYLFARTGVNGLHLSAKHLPLINYALKESREILTATVGSENAIKHGLETAQDIANAQALVHGRFMLGTGVVSMAAMHYTNGGLTGNGPQDPKKRQVWLDAGYKPRSIKLGDVWVSYDSFEPFGSLLAIIADLGDSQQLMGDEFVENNLLYAGLVASKAMISKTYLQGMQQLVDVFSRDPQALSKIGASMANNMVPLSSVRNEIGRVLNPYMKELSSGIADQVRNRNQITESLAGDGALPVKYDILTGRPINDWDFVTRVLNSLSPVQFNLDQSPGRQFLFASNYDLRTSTMIAPDEYGTNLTDSPRIRSQFQKAIGDQDLESKLAALAKLPEVKESLARMNEDLKNPFNNRRGIEPMTYTHNILIKDIFDEARSVAWAAISENPEVVALVNSERLAEAAKYNRNTDPELSRSQYDESRNILKLQNR